MKLEVGKSYKIRSDASFKPKKIHIDAIIKNPYYSPRDNWIDNAEDLIVYRVWWNRRRYFKWYIESYSNLCLINEWPYKKYAQ